MITPFRTGYSTDDNSGSSRGLQPFVPFYATYVDCQKIHDDRQTETEKRDQRERERLGAKLNSESYGELQSFRDF